MIRILDLLVFSKAANAGSFSAAARQLNLTPAKASNCIQRLEKTLGIRLFVRSTRNMRLSKDGERYLPYAQAILDAVDNSRHAISESRETIQGKLRISAPSDFGRNRLIPWLDNFQQKHPQLAIQIHISDQPIDLFQQSIDLCIRYGELQDSSVVSLPLIAMNRRALCASPAYLAEHGFPKTPEDLKQHNCICYILNERIYDTWRFHYPNEIKSIHVEGNRICDDADLAKKWAISGYGIIYKSRLDLFPEIQSGKLVEIFPSEYGEPAPLQLLCDHRHSLTPEVRLLHEYIKAHCDELYTCSKRKSA
ncbi:Transcriptional regulator, LysR family [Photobacterium marinum]|uniref:Transcriptional regulator, LysR family n=1 Tax=Photobacterium marinum TaxID=1056511 RepID=L8JDI0_9GAMM|nr:LysR family transcriptional regulator [Photobacterium marinum]ELR66875.1 Transcriptional regulator, LysR family [Photobacterium marinum]